MSMTNGRWLAHASLALMCVAAALVLAVAGWHHPVWVAIGAVALGVLAADSVRSALRARGNARRPRRPVAGRRVPVPGASALHPPHGCRASAMSLTPAERRALTGVENELRRSDPGLAAMLTTFTLPLTLRPTICLARAFRRVAGRLALALILPGACVIAMSWLMISQPSQPGCPPGIRASSPGQVGGICDRSGGSAFRSGEPRRGQHPPAGSAGSGHSRRS